MGLRRTSKRRNTEVLCYLLQGLEYSSTGLYSRYPTVIKIRKSPVRIPTLSSVAKPDAKPQQGPY